MQVCLIFFLVPTITPNVLVIPTINGQQQISINININVSTNNTSDAALSTTWMTTGKAII